MLRQRSRTPITIRPYAFECTRSAVTLGEEKQRLFRKYLLYASQLKTPEMIRETYERFFA